MKKKAYLLSKSERIGPLEKILMNVTGIQDVFKQEINKVYGKLIREKYKM